ncbi:MAG: hypothetical protein WDZ35_07610 [Crocinitomicaceae bacterium]
MFFFLLNICSFGQADTLYVDGTASLEKYFYSDNLQRLSIEEDLVYSIQDSNLFSGYVVLADTFYHGENKWQTSTKHLEFKEGIADIRYIATFQLDTTNHIVNNWKKYETFKTDSTRIDISFYPNGKILKETSQKFGDELAWTMVTSYFDTSGIITKKFNRLLGQQIHGEVNMLLSDSNMLILHYKNGNLDTVLNNNVYLFSIHDKQVSMSEFRHELIHDDLNWSLFLYKTKDERQVIVMYTFDKTCSRNILQEELCLTEKRKKKLKRKSK